MREKDILERSHISTFGDSMYYSAIDWDWAISERSKFMREVDALSLGLVGFGVYSTSSR